MTTTRNWPGVWESTRRQRESKDRSRGAHAGPSDETPLEKLHRLSALMESVATEIESMRSATYRNQLWQQWAAICQRRPEYQQQKRLGSASGGAPT